MPPIGVHFLDALLEGCWNWFVGSHGSGSCCVGCRWLGFASHLLVVSSGVDVMGKLMVHPLSLMVHPLSREDGKEYYATIILLWWMVVVICKWSHRAQQYINLNWCVHCHGQRWRRFQGSQECWFFEAMQHHRDNNNTVFYATLGGLITLEKWR